MSSLRVLYLSPWMRPLARVYSESLLNAGAEVLLVTSDRHPESDAARPYELVLNPRMKTLSTWREFARAEVLARRFAPNVVVAEIVRDPRWMAFGVGVPRVHLVHDDKVHDDFDLWRPWEGPVFSRWLRRSAATVAFSQYVGTAIGADAVVPLTSDLDETRVALPPIVPAEGRRDFIVLGRMYDYKNLDVCMQAWKEHTSGSGWRGDNLVLIGDGEWSGAIPEHVIWHRKEFRYRDVLAQCAQAKGSVAHYRQPSQSGVQVLSMQLGVTPIVSTMGALPEFQAPGTKPIPIDDVDGLARAFDSLADPVRAAESGASCREHYVRNYSAAVSARELRRVLLQVSQDPRRR
jgi:glycosyltransferase involved in cell wall biosynthesis